jgi:glycosyltransferase involved in cell wall biosynthesis
VRLLYVSADPGVPVLGHKGASVHVRALVSALAAKGVSVVLASPRIAPEGERLDAPVELVRIEPVLPKEHASVASLLTAVGRQAAEILEVARLQAVEAVYERHSLFSIGGSRAAAALRLPHVLEVNAPLHQEALRFRGLAHARIAASLELEAFGRTDRILAVSETLAGLLEGAGVARGRIEVVANAVDPDEFETPRARTENVFRIGFAGSMKPWHGIDVLVAAFLRALPEVPELRLEIIGDGPARTALDGVRLPAGVMTHRGQLTHAETVRAMAGWEVGAAPFRALREFYFSPLKLVEYMAAGVCPVASDVPELRSLLGNGARGVLVEPGNADALAAAFVRLACDRERTAALGTQAREYVLRTRSWSRNATRALRALGREPAELVA